MGGRLYSYSREHIACYNVPIMKTIGDSSLFRAAYRIASFRMRGWDYSAAGFYCVTICTKDKQCCFGDIIEIDGEPGAAILLSDIGKIVAERWNAIPEQYPHVSLDVHQVMPNHFHGLLFIEEQKNGITLGVIINQFKGACTSRIRAGGYRNFSWQQRFHDHIVRDEKDLERIRFYIQKNPAAWLHDEDEEQGQA